MSVFFALMSPMEILCLVADSFSSKMSTIRFLCSLYVEFHASRRAWRKNRHPWLSVEVVEDTGRNLRRARGWRGHLRAKRATLVVGTDEKSHGGDPIKITSGRWTSSERSIMRVAKKERRGRGETWQLGGGGEQKDVEEVERQRARRNAVAFRIKGIPFLFGRPDRDRGHKAALKYL